MKKALSLFTLILLLAGCNTLFPASTYKKALARATAQRWSSGVKDGGRGVTFRIMFYQLNTPLDSDTLWVNNQPLTTELTAVGDTTYVTSFFFTEQTEQRTLVNSADYRGRLRVIADEKVVFLEIESFTILEPEYAP